MPISTDEPQVFAENRFEPGREGLTGPNGWAVYTKPRQERNLARQLLAGTVPFYLPLISKRLRIRKRTFIPRLPLLAPGTWWKSRAELWQAYAAGYLTPLLASGLWLRWISFSGVLRFWWMT